MGGSKDDLPPLLWVKSLDSLTETQLCASDFITQQSRMENQLYYVSGNVCL